MTDNERFSDAVLARLRDAVRAAEGDKRYYHTIGVEKKAAELAAVFAPDRARMLRAAALLHDITKEWSAEKQLAFCRQYGIDPGEACFAPKLFHARTAAELVRQRFPECADTALLSAIEHHTEGAPDMTLCDKLLYLADYIEDTRTFPDCVSLRSYYETELAAARTDKERLTALDRVLLRSFDLTIRCLLDEHAYLAVKTVASRNAILDALKKEGENAV